MNAPVRPSARFPRFARNWLAAAGCMLMVSCASAPSPAATTPGSASRRFVEQAVQIPAPGLVLSGVLFTPKDRPAAAARHPAIVLLHGCGGLRDSRGQLVARHRDWAERFAGQGFVALLVDSFAPRAVSSICDLKERPILPWRERSLDTYAALDYLTRRPDVDAGSVFLLGWSNGGSTVLGAVRPDAPGRPLDGPQFKAAIAFYPGCTLPLRQRSYRPNLPVLILHGGADDWTPSGPCVALAEQLQARRVDLRTIVYPGAHHGFDQPGERPVRLLPNAYNPKASGERGAHVGPHPQARAAAIEAVDAFIALHRGRRAPSSSSLEPEANPLKARRGRGV